MRAPVWGALAQFKQTSEIFGWLDAIVRNMDVPDLKPPPSRVASPLVVSMGVNTKREQTHQVSTGGACKRWPVHVCVALFFLQVQCVYWTSAEHLQPHEEQVFVPMKVTRHRRQFPDPQTTQEVIACKPVETDKEASS